MQRIRLAILSLGFGALAAIAPPAAAEPTIRGSFMLNCTTTLVERSANPNEDFNLHFGVAGLDSLARRYRLVLEVSGLDGGPLPDAWRFDAGGCQGRENIAFYTYIAAAIKTCPTNMPPLASWDEFTSELLNDGLTLRVEFARRFVERSVISGPLERILVMIQFWHHESVLGPASSSEQCGGFETPVCIRLVEATHEDWLGRVRSFTRINDTYSVQAEGGVAACAAVPAKIATWGAIKGQYR